MSAASTSAVPRRIPPEILPEILLNLPVKSLLRFSTVSKSWLSIISESRFVQEHMRRAAVNGVKRMVTGLLCNHLDRDISVCRIPHTSSMENDDSIHLIFPIEKGQRRVRAFCDGLWLVEAEVFRRRLYVWRLRFRETVKKSLYLWNPSTRKHRKLPDPLLLTTGTEESIYGLGYDSAADDYKVLKIAWEEPTQLYSLKSDSWKTISPSPAGIYWQERCEYLNGLFHWIPTSSNAIVTFDLSTEKCGEITLPALSFDSGYNGKYVVVVVTRGKLCVSVNSAMFNPDGSCFALWVMEEYGVEKSWTKVLNIDHGYYRYGKLKPVHFYDNGDILLNASYVGLCMYKNEGARLEWIVARDGRALRGGFIYVESLVSPLPIIKTHHEINVSFLNMCFQACLK